MNEQEYQEQEYKRALEVQRELVKKYRGNKNEI